MKSKTFLLILFVLGILGVIKVLFLKEEKSPVARPGVKNAPIAIVTGFIAHAQEFETKIFSSGTVKANEEVQLRPEVQGKLVWIFFEEGGFIKKGTLLAKINDIDLQVQLKKLDLQSKLAQEKVRRLKGLLDISGVSIEDYDVAENQLAIINADMDYVRAQIAKTEIRAPFDGKIGLRQVSAGSIVTSLTLIASMQQSDILKIDFTVPEKYASIIAVGDSLHFTVENLDGIFTAKIFAIEPRIDEQTRNIMVRGIYNSTETIIFPGSFARIELMASKKEAAILIPTEAVIPELKGKKVYLYKSGKATPIKVETGTRTDASIEIISGVTAGDTVIVTGIMSLKPDMDVKLIELKK